MQISHVAADPRNSQKPGTAVDHFFKLGRVEAPLAHEINEHAWVQITASGTHDDAAGGGKPHARVDRPARPDSGDARTIAKVSDDQTLRKAAAELAYNRFTRKAMKPKTLDALRLQVFGERKNACNIRQSGMECRVETRYLSDAAEKLLRMTQNRQRRRNMQRSKNAGGLELFKHGIIDQAVLTNRCSAMHDPVPNRGRSWLIGVSEKSRKSDQRVLLIRKSGFVSEHLSAICISRAETRGSRALPFRFSRNKERGHGWPNAIKAEFQRRGAAV